VKKYNGFRIKHVPGLKSVPGRKVLQLAIAAAVACYLFAALAQEASAVVSRPVPLVRPAAFKPLVAPSGAKALGSVADSQSVELTFSIAPRDPAGVQALVNALYTPGSAEYHHWLAKGQFLREFGPSRSTLESVESWLKERGLSKTTDAGFAIDATATAGQVERALGLSLENYRTNSGVVGFRATQAPLVPANLAAGTVTAVLGLDTLSQFQDFSAPLPNSKRSSSHASTRKSSFAKPDADGLTPCADATTTATDDDSYTLDTLGSDYQVGSLLSDSQNGTGQTVAVYELAPHSASDVSAYQTCFGLTNTVSTVEVDTGGTVNSNGTAEADIDIEQIATQSPDSSIISYEGPNSEDGAYDTWNSIVTADAASVVSSSWGECEPYAQDGGAESSYSTLFSEAASQGQTVLVASGDSGSESCFQSDETTTALEVGYPASDPHVTAVGGTTLSSSGETAWNYCDDESGGDECALYYGGLGAGTGGLSRYEGKPGWQPTYFKWATSQPCGTVCRQVPDVSANAGAGMVVYVNGGWNAYIGTSLAAPFLAGIVADANTGCGTKAGLYAQSLYSLAAQSVYGTALNDVTSGNNDFTDTNDGMYAAGKGYDMATGLGSPRAQGLSCAEISSVSPTTTAAGSDVQVSGLGLEKATIEFGSQKAQVLSATATEATVVVPSGSGTVSVTASNIFGHGSAVGSFTYGLPAAGGYRLVTSKGNVYTFDAPFYGSEGADSLPAPIVGVCSDQLTGGYVLVSSKGNVYTFDSTFHGSEGSTTLPAPIVGIACNSTTGGYVLVSSRGNVYTFDSTFYGSEGGKTLPAPIVGITYAPLSGGYILVSSKGNVYTFNTTSYGSEAGKALPAPIVGITANALTGGYVLASSKGNIYTFNSTFYGSEAGKVIPAPIVGIGSDRQTGGYLLTSSKGNVYTFDEPSWGSTGADSLPAPMVGIGAT
jgi:subtilase family serine protease